MEEARQEGLGEIDVRPATADDRGFVLGLVPRFVEFGLPPRHDPGRVMPAIERSLGAALIAAGGDTAVLVAEENGERVDFVHVKAESDYFSGEPRAYVSDVAVAPEAEGRGLGRVLMGAAEAWARARGYRTIALDAFAANARARAVYRRLGYEEDTVKMIKDL
ncbi:MAG: GNAT family N-acetyltransferase [Actinomycetota bacterium]|nr:GNAT family N-acetyltransferase [Actinomycetota bacterium]